MRGRASGWGVIGLIFAAGACGGTSDDAAGLTVFAAASLTEAFTEIGDAYEQRAGVEVIYSFAGSSELATQIVEGAPADVYASADLVTMARVVDAESIDYGPAVFAANSMEIAVAPGNPLGIEGLEDLDDPDLVLVMCAPQVPCGAYAELVLTRADVRAVPDSYERNVKSVVTKVALGEADAGIVYATDVAAAADDVAGVEIPAEFNGYVEYPIATVAESADPDGGRAFIDFVFGETGQDILADYGFTGR